MGARRAAGAGRGRRRRSAFAAFSVDFLTHYWLHFELVSVLLVVGVVAALAVIAVGRATDG